MKVIKYISILLFTLLCGYIYGQNEVAIDPTAKSILDKASAKFNTEKGLSANLLVTVENEQKNKNENFKASLLLKKDKFMLDIAQVQTFYDGKTEYVYLKKEKEVNISEPQKEDLEELNPIFLMNSYRNGYKMKFIGVKEIDGKSVDIIDLYPNDRSKQFSILTIYIDKVSSMPVRFRAKGKNGINTIVKIESYKNTSLDDKSFKFDFEKNKNIEVIDLR